MTISVIIITYNEEENIKECLESVKWADEIIVVDSFSSDKTVQIGKEYTDKVIQKEFSGDGPQRQVALNLATKDWILNLDADERVSKELKEEILSKINNHRLTASAYYIPYKFYWLGKPLRFGRFGVEKHVRFFRRDKGRYSTHIVHSKVEVEGKIGHFKNHIFHFSYKDIEDYFTRLNQYTTLSAVKKFNEGKKAHFDQFFPPVDFCIRYFLKLGFLDGMPGFLYAWFSSFHRFVKYAKLWELWQKKV
ncbi:MAG: glycosyltransferase family 2 protein [bacterium]|nr:glycosyltransferase family 2 protein [bacterium]